MLEIDLSCPKSDHSRTGIHRKRQPALRLFTAALIATLTFTLVLDAATHRVTAQEAVAGVSPTGQAILDGVNQQRINNGLPPLQLDPLLTQAAQSHVDDIVSGNAWGHYGSDGSTVQIRVARTGFPSDWVSENWVMSQSPESAVDWWMNDWIHRVNILTPHWDKIGVGAALSGNGWWVFVTDFANLDGAYEPFEASTYTARAESVPGAVEEIPSGGLNYTVASGDTLLGIGLRYGLDWQDLAIANNMGEFDILSVGQALYIPSVGGTGGPVESDGPAVEAGDEVHEVQPGDTLLTISFRYGVDWQAIAAVNGLGEYDLLQIGQTLALPASVTAGGSPSASRQAGDAEVEESVGPSAEDAAGAESQETTGDAVNETEASSAESSGAGASSFTGSYTVQAGDTLSTIAGDFAIDWEALAAANNLSEDDYLQLGQTLVVPGDSPAGTAPAAEDEPTAASAAKLTLTPVTKSYEVESGDTALAIALRHGISLEELLAANGLDDDSILGIGDLLEIPQ